VHQQADGRERRLLGHGLHADADKRLKEHPNVSRYEIKKPTLEEIFVAYMK
jgi:hypothetical protein